MRKLVKQIQKDMKANLEVKVLPDSVKHVFSGFSLELKVIAVFIPNGSKTSVLKDSSNVLRHIQETLGNQNISFMSILKLGSKL